MPYRRSEPSNSDQKLKLSDEIKNSQSSASRVLGCFRSNGSGGQICSAWSLHDRVEYDSSSSLALICVNPGQSRTKAPRKRPHVKRGGFHTIVVDVDKVGSLCFAVSCEFD